jgi:hypothetical protein
MNDKEPAVDAVVTLIPLGSRRSAPYHKHANVDASGHFTIGAIAPGPYRLIAWDRVNVNAVIYDPDFLKPYESAGQRIQFDSAEKKKVGLKVTVNQNPVE